MKVEEIDAIIARGRKARRFAHLRSKVASLAGVRS
jgi:hypothetical protein